MLTHFIAWLLSLALRLTVRNARPAPQRNIEPGEIDGKTIGREIPWDDDAPQVEPIPVRRDPDLDRKGWFIIGKAGSGKSHLLQTLEMQDVKSKTNVVVISNSGDDIDNLIEALAAKFRPADLEGRLILIDHTDDRVVVPDNVLAGPGTALSRGMGLVGLLDQSFDISSKVQVADTCMNLFAALAEAKATIADYDLVFHDPAFREYVAENSSGPVQDWIRRLGGLTAEQRNTLYLGVANKMTPLLLDHHQNLAYGANDAFPFRKVFDDPAAGKIVLFKSGAEANFVAGRFAASVFATRLLTAFMARTDLPEGPESRVPCRLYIDEAHGVLANSPAFQRILPESRRMGLITVPATQTTTQVSGMLDLILGTASTLVLMQMSPKDAAILARNVRADVPLDTVRRALVNLDVGEAVLCRTGYDTVRVRLNHQPYPKASKEAVATVREVGLRAFGRPAADIEAEIAERRRTAIAQTSAGSPVLRTPRKGRFAPKPADGRDPHGGQ